MWNLDVGLLGVTSDDIFGRIGVARGFRHGFQLDVNLVHWAVGLFNARTRWAFFERSHVGLSLELGVFYAHGGWVWILDERQQDALGSSDLFAFPLAFTISTPINRWLQFDLAVQYQYSQVFGDLGSGESFYADSQVGARQLVIRPTGRLFVSENIALEISAKLAPYNRVPVQIEGSVDVGGQSLSGSLDEYVDVPFSDSWIIETGLRARLQSWLYATVRLHYGQVSNTMYGAAVSPSFIVEFRL